jgi:hypothetical protein
MPCRSASHRSATLQLLSAMVCLAATVAVAACSDGTTSPGTAHELDGPAVAVGNGTARVYVLERGDAPETIGIELSEAALTGLPDSMAMWQLPLPTSVSVPPWDHAMLNWNPQGHPPPEIYGVAHFDFHFYTIPVDAQMAIPAGPDTETVAPQYVPLDYASEVFAVPAMGVHWEDTLATEFHGQPFDRTFIYGFYQRQMVFVEPMVTLAYLQSHPDASMSVKQPAAYQLPGRYPRTYGVHWDGAQQTVRVSLDSLTAE